MRKSFLSFFILILCGGFVSAQSICGGQSATLQAQNPQNLSGPSYSLNPGGFTSPTGQFVVTPPSTTTYTLYTSGTNTNNTFTTTTAVVQVTVLPQPIAAPTVTNFACNTTTNCWNLNLTFNPAAPPPQFTITWAAPDPTTAPNVPPGWTNPQTSQCGTLAPSVYTAIITAAGGCSTTTIFSVNPPPAPANYSLSPSPGYSLTCNVQTLNIAASNPSLAYTFNSAATGPISNSSVSVTFTNAGTWTVTGVNNTSGCVRTITFAVTPNTVAPLSSVSPTFQTITCTNSIPTNVTLTAVNPTVNFEHFVYSQQQTFWNSNLVTAFYQPGPGTYTHCLVNLATGCSTCKEFTVNSTAGFPTFGIQSAPGGFSLGCSSKSLTTITFTNAQTTPTPGGSVSYTIFPPGSNGVTPSGSLSTQQSWPFTQPGSYTAVVNDDANSCETRLAFSIITNTLPPAIDSVLVPRRILDCDDPFTVIEGFSSTEGVSYSWAFPTSSGTGNLASKPYTVSINTFVPPTTTLIANFTLSITENNNMCVSRTVVPIYQNLFPPQAFGSPSSPSITCSTPSVVITNFSTSKVPVGSIFPTGLIVEATRWQGPSPQLDLLNSTTYTGTIPGDYTLTVLDRNNGCTSSTIITIGDDRDYPLLGNSYSATTLDCGEKTALMTPVLTNARGSETFTWVAPPAAATSNKNDKVLSSDKVGTYTVLIRNPSSGCRTIDSLRIVQGTLTPAILADKTSGYAPLKVNFVNNSVSGSGSAVNNASITTVWSFDVDSVLTTESASISPSIVYNQPGNYTVTAYVKKGLCLDTTHAYISVDIPSEIKIPNVFSPNGDGINDLFFLQRSANLSEIVAKIYDRWGNLVYEVTSTKGNIEWDGKTQAGKDAAEGTYFIILTAKGKDDASYDEKGTITLVR